MNDYKVEFYRTNTWTGYGETYYVPVRAIDSKDAEAKAFERLKSNGTFTRQELLSLRLTDIIVLDNGRT